MRRESVASRFFVACALIAFALVVGLSTCQEAYADWSHTQSGGYDVWYWNWAQKFRYDLTNHQWGHYSTVDSQWYTLTATGVADTFIGDGGWYDLGTGFSYSYVVGSYLGYFKKGGTTDRFAYFYSQARWVAAGNTGGWQDFAGPGLSASFVGDSAWHDLNNGFTYSYVAASDLAYFKKGGITYRFGYYYGLTRWVAAGGTGGWQYLGNAGLSASFVGDAASHDLLNGFTYSYVAASDLAYFKKGGTTDRFAYFYSQSRWVAAGNTGGWQDFGGTGLSAGFLGDGSGHNLGNGFTLTYTPGTADYGTFTLTASGAYRFMYGYTTGQWQHYGAYGADPHWANLCNDGLSASFLGDGSGHNLGTWNQPGSGNWYFTYYAGTGASDDKGQFGLSASGNNRFAYVYSSGQWQFYEQGTTWKPIGASQSLASFFIGDGSEHPLYNGAHWTLQYVAADDRFLIKQIVPATGYQYLAYSFVGPYWMDAAGTTVPHIYGLAEITGGSSPYWLSSTGDQGLNLTSSTGVTMFINLITYPWTVSYYFDSSPLPWYYVSYSATWCLYSDDNSEPGGPSLHRY